MQRRRYTFHKLACMVTSPCQYGTLWERGIALQSRYKFFCKEVKLIDKDTEVQNIGSYEHTFAVPDKDDNGQMLPNYRVAGLADIVAAIAEEGPHRCSIELLFTQ